jgi:hypothetical protein
VYDWHSEIEALSKTAKARAEEESAVALYGLNTLAYKRAKVLKIYEGRRTQWAIALLITLAFVVDILEAQLLPEPRTRTGRLFFGLEVVITLLFLAEFAIHMFAASLNGLKMFFTTVDNCFDALVVFVR